MFVWWLGIVIVLIVIEAMTLGLTTIWFAAGGIVAAILAAFELPLYAQIVSFIIISGVLLVFTRPIAVRYFNKNRIKTNVLSLVGKQAIVISTVDNLQGTGQATVGGVEWSAMSYDERITYNIGEVVTVVDIKGAKLVLGSDIAND